MKNKTVGQFRPEAWIAVSNSRQKIYGNKQVLLDDNQEFQIELYNPTSLKYLAKIYINGKTISHSGLVIRPGQRYFLDRFIDEDRKLLFSTYEVEADNAEVQKAIEGNGLVKVEFYAENSYVNSGITWTNTSTSIPLNWGNPQYTTFTYTANGHQQMNSSYSTNDFTFTTNSLSNCFSSSVSENKMMETGRIEKGEKSDQSFGDDYGSYSWSVSYVSEYQILPRSAKPMEISEIRSYCTECRTRIKKKTWKYCPTCGESLS